MFSRVHGQKTRAPTPCRSRHCPQNGQMACATTVGLPRKHTLVTLEKRAPRDRRDPSKDDRSALFKLVISNVSCPHLLQYIGNLKADSKATSITLPYVSSIHTSPIPCTQLQERRTKRGPVYDTRHVNVNMSLFAFFCHTTN